jgi:8-oxo-dGTP pyrophosphatase MutT (NUDIX family)
LTFRLCCLPLVLAACSDLEISCPVTATEAAAASAGCFSVSEGELLVVQDFSGRLSLPGGSSEPGESARCTAFRETWEETGLRLVPGERLRVFDTGFHLYRCERNDKSGEIDPPFRLEVRDVFFLGPERFTDYEWRFDDQRELLREMLLNEAATAR